MAGFDPSASPHTRGWTVVPGDTGQEVLGFPAHAGMDPAPGGSSRGRRRLPRTRGDGPRSTERDSSPAMASPHTRGWTRGWRCAGVRDVGFPAHAGMDPPRRWSTRRRHRLPRTRGDGPDIASPLISRPLASPHTRGWTLNCPRMAPISSGFPAHAGMDPAATTRPALDQWLPRTRGDGPLAGVASAIVSLASPHTRGWTASDFRLAPPDSGFPAHAGMDPSTTPTGTAPRRLPRTRGDGPRIRRRRARADMASPHTRGWTPTPRRTAAVGGGFPAHAGMDRSSAAADWGWRRLPRTRGDGPMAESGCRVMATASPHTRGWTAGRRETAAQRGGFPAHAGMDLNSNSEPTPQSGLPRTRGDGPESGPEGEAEAAASPHTRGWTRPSTAT